MKKVMLLLLVLVMSGCAITRPRTYIDFSKEPYADLNKYEKLIFIPGLLENDSRYPRLMELYQALHYEIYPKGYRFVSNIEDADAVVLIVFMNWPDIEYQPGVTLPIPVWTPGTTTDYYTYDKSGKSYWTTATTQGSYSTGYVSQGPTVKEIRRLAVSAACYEKDSQKVLWSGNGMARVDYDKIGEGYNQIIKDIAKKLPKLRNLE